MWSGFPPAYWDLYFRTNTPPTWASACPMGSKGNLRDTSCALLSKSWWKGGEKMVKRWWRVLPWYFPSRWRHHLWQEGELFWHNHVHHSWAPNPIWHVTSWGKDPLKNVMFFLMFLLDHQIRKNIFCCSFRTVQKNVWLFSAMCSPGMMIYNNL